MMSQRLWAKILEFVLGRSMVANSLDESGILGGNYLSLRPFVQWEYWTLDLCYARGVMWRCLLHDSWCGKAHTDELREIWGLICTLGAVIDQALRFEFGEWQATGHQAAVFIQQFVAFAVEQDPPVPRYPFFARVLAADARGTICRNGVIPARLGAH